MGKCCIAVDFGASSGRMIKGNFENGKLVLEEVHRFYNGIVPIRGHDCWEIDRLFDEILEGFKCLKKEKVQPDSIAVDTWGVDYVLIDKEGNRIGLPIAYRDHRTETAVKDFSEVISDEDLYRISGIQFMPFNTLYQLFVHKNQNSQELENADALLFIPDYFNFLLSGEKVNEYTEASTSQMLNAANREWSTSIISKLGIPKSIIKPIVKPGSIIGDLKKEWKKKFGFSNARIVASPSHDTASAALAAAVKGKNAAFISSGTWSLLGCELDQPICTSEAFNGRYTNEGGAGDKTLFLTNIMGMWLIQECMKLFVPPISYQQLDEMVSAVKPFRSVIDVTDLRFMNPQNMMEEIRAYCEETKQPAPVTPGQFGRCVFDSLAICYRNSLLKLESITGNKIKYLSIVGGGCQNKLLNQLTADLIGITVSAGPIEATAIGNMIMQLKALGEIEDDSQIKQIIVDSFEICEFVPSENQAQLLRLVKKVEKKIFC